MKPKAEFKKIAELEEYLKNHFEQGALVYPAYRVKYQSEYGLRFPGSERAYSTCGELMRVDVCPDYGNPTINGVNHSVKIVKNHCDRPGCEVCSSTWMYRESERAKDRIEKAMRAYLREGVKLGFPKHWSISPPQEDWIRIIQEKGLTGILQLRREAEKLVSRSGVKGGAIMVHPWRWDEKTKERYLSPHVHIVGFGFLMKTDEFFKMSGGWFAKFLGYRDSIFKTIAYLLSHTCISDGYKTLSYFGYLSYNKLKKINFNIRKERPKCDCCGKDLISFCFGLDGLIDYSEMFNSPFISVESFEYQVVERRLSSAILA